MYRYTSLSLKVVHWQPPPAAGCLASRDAPEAPDAPRQRRGAGPGAAPWRRRWSAAGPRSAVERWSHGVTGFRGWVAGENPGKPGKIGWERKNWKIGWLGKLEKIGNQGKLKIGWVRENWKLNQPDEIRAQNEARSRCSLLAFYFWAKPGFGGSVHSWKLPRWLAGNVEVARPEPAGPMVQSRGCEQLHNFPMLCKCFSQNGFPWISHLIWLIMSNLQYAQRYLLASSGKIVGHAWCFSAILSNPQLTPWGWLVGWIWNKIKVELYTWGMLRGFMVSKHIFCDLLPHPSYLHEALRLNLQPWSVCCPVGQIMKHRRSSLLLLETCWNICR